MRRAAMSDSAPETPTDSPLTMQDVLASEHYRDLTTAKVLVGDPAPDFALPEVDPAGAGRGASGLVRLSDFRGRVPVALVFGSYT